MILGTSLNEVSLGESTGLLPLPQPGYTSGRIPFSSIVCFRGMLGSSKMGRLLSHLIRFSIESYQPADRRRSPHDKESHSRSGYPDR